MVPVGHLGDNWGAAMIPDVDPDGLLSIVMERYAENMDASTTVSYTHLTLPTTAIV